MTHEVLTRKLKLEYIETVNGMPIARSKYAIYRFKNQAQMDKFEAIENGDLLGLYSFESQYNQYRDLDDPEIFDRVYKEYKKHKYSNEGLDH